MPPSRLRPPASARPPSPARLRPPAFIPTAGKTPRELPTTPAEHAYAVEEREALKIEFPHSTADLKWARFF